MGPLTYLFHHVVGDADADDLVGQLLASAAVLRDAVLATEGEVIRLLHRARASGATWDQIGVALGMSRQAAHRRYAQRVNGDEPPSS